MYGKRRENGRGFTLLETLVALAIYAVLIAALVVVNRGGLENLSELEERALARRALANVITTFRLQAKQGRVSAAIGRHSGHYQMSHFDYYWEVQLASSQNQQTRLLSAEIRLKGENDTLARLREIW